MNTREFSTAMPGLRFLPTLQLMRLSEAAERVVLEQETSYHRTLLSPAPAIHVLRGVVRTAPLALPPPGRIGLHWAGEWVIPNALLGSEPAGFSLSACESTELLTIDREALLGAARRNPDLALYLAEQCAAEAAELARWLHTTATHSALGRVAQLLLYLRRQRGSDAFRLPTTSTHLARYAACSREAFTRNLTKLVQRGVIARTAHTVHIVNPDALAAVQ